MIFSISVPVGMKRMYPKMFISKIADAFGESGETEVWLDFSLDCGYIKKVIHADLINKYVEVNKMLFGMIGKPERFVLRLTN